MSDRIRAHLRSNVVGYIALFCFAMSGTAIATHPGGDDTIDTFDIINGEVKSPDILDDTVGSVDLRNFAIQGQDVVNNGLGGNKISDNTIAAADIATGGVGSDEIGDESVTSGDISSDTIQQVDLANDVIASAEVVNDSLTAADISLPAGRDGANFIDIPGDGTAVALTTATITPTTFGSVRARAHGFCNLHEGAVGAGTFYNVAMAIGTDATNAYGSFLADQGLIGTLGAGGGESGTTSQEGFSAERIAPGFAGVPVTLSVFGRENDVAVDSNTDCSASLTLEELPDTPLEPARRATRGSWRTTTP